LLLRADNAADRLTPIAAELGLLNTTELGRLRHAAYRERCTQATDLRTWADQVHIEGRTAADTLRGNDVPLAAFLEWASHQPDIYNLPRAVWATVHADLRYESYVRREAAHIRRTHEMETRRLPHAIDYAAISGLRNEARNALTRFRPDTFGQAGRLEGVTPADLSLVAVHMKRWGEQHSRDHHNHTPTPPDGVRS
jgi:tRNA uridine 5-carboxymethylaminomethyl modification enzyme